MEKIGEIYKILNDAFLIVKITNQDQISKIEDLVVYREIKGKLLDAIPEIPQLIVPLGTISLLNKQHDDLFLAKLCEISRKTKYILPAYDQLMKGLYSTGSLGKAVEVVERSGTLDSTQAVGVEIKEVISIGDYVGVER